VFWEDRNDLCGGKCTACPASRWAATNGVVIPKHHYWTDDELYYTGGTSFTCGVRSLIKGDSPCSTFVPEAGTSISSPMRVCMGNTAPDASYGVYDPEGNLCNVTHCGYNGDTPDAQDLYFGGCGGNPTAGTLCCCP
jgi:hypothetical protein